MNNIDTKQSGLWSSFTFHLFLIFFNEVVVVEFKDFFILLFLLFFFCRFSFGDATFDSGMLLGFLLISVEIDSSSTLYSFIHIS